MKKLSKQESEPKQNSKKPKTNTDITSKLLSNVNEQIFKQVSLGKISLNPVPTILQKKVDVTSFINPEENLENVELNLKAIRSSIIEQKRAEKEQERVRLIKAQELIQRIKKEKEQYQLRLKEKNEKSVLERRLYSDTTLNKMRAKLQERIANKRQEIEERVRAIEERKLKRDEKIAGQQIQYWQGIKEVKQKAKSSSRLPSLMKNEGRESNLSLSHKNSEKKMSLLAKGPNQQDFLRWKQESSKLKPIEQRNHGILEKLKGSHKNLSRRLHAESVIFNEFIPNHNKHKLMGDQFLKESLLLAKKSRVTVEEEGSLRDSMEVEAHEAHLNKNEKVEKMREKWERMLLKIKHSEITKEQGLELLNNIEKRLDKMDLHGVKERLKKKYEIFDKIEI